PYITRQVSVCHVFDSLLRERLLLCFLVELKNRLDFLPPELFVEAWVRHLRVHRADVSRREGVRGQFVIQDVAWSDSDELRRGSRQVFRDVSRLDSSIRDCGVNPKRPRVRVGEGRYGSLHLLVHAPQASEGDPRSLPFHT